MKYFTTMTKREAEELIEIEIDGTEKPECTEESIVEQTYTPAECISQAIDINEPIGNLKKLLEPRLQCSLDAHEICLQDIQLDPERSLFDQGVKTDGTVQLSVQVISYQGKILSVLLFKSLAHVFNIGTFISFRCLSKLIKVML